MSSITNNKPDISKRLSFIVPASPLAPTFVMQYFAMKDELKKLKQRLEELEAKNSGEGEVIMIRDITREDAKREIKQLFKSERTLYYSDIVKELGIELEMVVDICNELQEKKEIEKDANVR